jgi:hypothetical protein
VHHRAETGFPPPEGRCSVPLDQDAERRIDAGQMLDRSPDARFVDGRDDDPPFGRVVFDVA